MTKNYLFKSALVASLSLFSVAESYAQWETMPDVPEDLVFPVAGVIGNNIHVVDRYDDNDVCNHYRFNTVTETWDTLAPLPYSTVMMAGDVANGKFHVFGGGYPNSGSPLSDHYSYDPGTDSWTQETDISPARAIHYARTIRDTLYSIAGQGVTTNFEMFNTDTDAWEDRANLPTTNFAYAGLAVSGEKLYRFGGGGYTAPTDVAHVYDPITDTWSSLPSLDDALHGPAALGLEGTNDVYIIGGYHSFVNRDEVWVYNTSTETYSAGPDLPVGRSYNVAVSVGDCIYSIGGNHAVDTTVNYSLLRYCPATAQNIENSLENAIVSSSNGMLEIVSDLGEEISFNIVDAQGKILYSGSMQDKFSTSTQNWSEGVVFVQLNSADLKTSKKVIITH